MRKEKNRPFLCKPCGKDYLWGGRRLRDDLEKEMGVEYLEQSRRAWWLSSWQIVIERYPQLGEEIVVSTWPYDFKGMYGYRNFTIQDQQNTYLVKANSVWFLFDTAAGRPVKVEERDIRGYGTGKEEKLDMETEIKIRLTEEEYKNINIRLEQNGFVSSF